MKLSSREQARACDDALEPIDWAALPGGVRRVDIDAASGTLAAIESGNSKHERVVLVPGLTGSKEDFQRMMPVFEAHGFFVESFDLAGQYESHTAGPENLTPARKRYDFELFVDDLITVLERIPGRSHVLGYSFGGNVAQEVFVRRPDLFASLTFLSAPPVPGQAFRKVKRIGWVSRITNGRIGGALMVWGVKSNVIPVSADRLAFVRARFALTRASSVGDTITLMRKTPNHRMALREAAVPKLVSVGAHDLWPIHVHEEFATAIEADFVVYDTGHSPCETTPHQLAWDMMQLIGRAGSN